MSFASRLGEAVDVELRPDEAGLLGTPPGEADGVARLDVELRDLECGLEQCRRSAAVVVDAGSGAHRVEVGARHDDAVVATGRRLGDEVLGRDVELDEGLRLEVHDDLALHRAAPRARRRSRRRSR